MTETTEKQAETTYDDDIHQYLNAVSYTHLRAHET